MAETEATRAASDEVDLTALLRSWTLGEPGARERLIQRVYPHLRHVAARELNRHQGRLSLQATELVNESYLRLVGSGKSTEWKDRKHFFNVAAKVMRRVLIDLVRHKAAQKRQPDQLGDAIVTVTLDSRTHPDILDLDAALKELGEIDHVAETLVELRYFAGLTVDEAAEVLGLARATVVRRWRFARSWLHHRLRQPDA